MGKVVFLAALFLHKGAQMFKKSLFLATSILGISAGSMDALCEPQAPARIIHVVYDDSGSMIADPETKYKTYVDTWCQAKYAMEVLASMLGENDSLHVYYMSSYSLDTSHEFADCKGKLKPNAANVLHVHGSANAAIIQQNVNLVQENTTYDGDTPFCPVVDAYQDLVARDGTKDNRWLVVLTDGMFEDSTSEVTQRYYHDFAKEANVVVLSIGKLVDTSVTGDEANGLFVRHAKTSQDVLYELTQIGNRIFQRNTVPVSADNSFSLNIPMKSLIVFAQGQGVDVGSVTNSQGQKSQRPAASIRATQPTKTHATTRKRDMHKIEEVIQGTNGSLNGQLATFSGFLDKRYLPPDTYHVDFSDTPSQNVQVYYDPFVGVGIYVKDAQGNAIDPQKVEPGSYHVDLRYENPDSHEAIDAQYLANPKTGEAAVIHGVLTITGLDPDTGKEVVISTSKFDMSTDFELQPGQRARIDYQGRYLEYNTINSANQPGGGFVMPIIVTNPKVSLMADNANGDGKGASYGITGAGFHADGNPMHFRLDAKDYFGKPVEISDADWNQFRFRVDPPEIAGVVRSFTVRKNPDRSVDIEPQFVDKGFADIASQKAEITVTPEIQSDSIEVEGNVKALMDFHNDIERDEIVWKPQTYANYCIVCEGINPKDVPVNIAVSLKNHEMTAPIWDAISAPDLALLKENRNVTGFGECQKTEQMGVFSCLPQWSDLALQQPFENDEDVVDYEIMGKTLRMDTLIATSPTEAQPQQFAIGKDIDVLCWLKEYWLQVLATLAGLTYLIGFAVKPTLPTVKDIITKMDDDQKGKTSHITNKSFRLVPFVAQTGRFTFRPNSGDSAKPIEFKLKAKDGGMVVQNLDSIRKQIERDSVSVMVGGKPINNKTKSISIPVKKDAIVITTLEHEYKLDILDKKKKA